MDKPLYNEYYNKIVLVQRKVQQKGNLIRLDISLCGELKRIWKLCNRGIYRDITSIYKVIPTMKSIGADKQENKASKSNEAEKYD